MSHITLYLSDEVNALLRQSAQASGMSNSKWVSNLICRYAKTEWPEEMRVLAGAFADFPLQQEVPSVLASDVERVIF